MPKGPRTYKDTQLPGDAFRVISRLYDSVTPGGTYEPMFLAMDDFIDATLHDAATDKLSAPIDPEFLTHFDRASEIFDKLSSDDVQTPLSYVEARLAPTAIATRSGRLVAQNTRFDQNFNSGSNADVSLVQCFATPADEQRFHDLICANHIDAKALVNIFGPDSGKQISLLASLVPDLAGAAENGVLVSLMMIQPQWSDDTAILLRDSFCLTPAEIETLQSFVALGSVKGIADARKRSIRTVRTQLSRIFAQMGVSSQTELALFLAALGNAQTRDANEAMEVTYHDTLDSGILRHVIKIAGFDTDVLEYGDRSGFPVLLLQSTHPPALTKQLRDALAVANLRIVAPLKPGSGKSMLLAESPNPELMASRYAAILDHLKIHRAVVAGQASGGLYALAFARQFPNLCKGVCLIDTGVPFLTRADLMHQPNSIRRTMVAARYFPKVLNLPHRLVAANFRRSHRGERSVVEYFFSGSPIDQALTRTQKDAYAVTRDIIGYSFDDIDGLVNDVVRWASNWQESLDAVVAQTPLCFVHGAENTMFLAEPVQAFAELHHLCSAVVIPNQGQLAVFQEPATLAKALISLST